MEVGYDAGKKIKGRKRHIITDIEGNLLDVVVHSAGMQDRDGARLLIDKIAGKFDRLVKLLADGAYAGKVQQYCHLKLNAMMVICKRITNNTFAVIPKRWVVERTFAWLNNARRLSKDYERTPRSARTFILIATIRLNLRRIAI